MSFYQFTDNATGDVVTMERHPDGIWREVHRRPPWLKQMLNELRAARDRTADAVRKYDV